MGYIENIKREARRLKKTGEFTHMSALEFLSKQRGYRGWNDLLKSRSKEEENNVNK